MFTAGTDVLGCSKSDRLWFLLKGRNQSLSYLPISASVGACCQHMRAILYLLVPGTRSGQAVGHRGYSRANDIGIWINQTRLFMQL